MNYFYRKLIYILIVFFTLFVNTLAVKCAVQKGCAAIDSDEEFILFIVDFSNSMTEKLHGTQKINMVLDTMQELLPKLPENKRVGLRVYGHKGGYAMPGHTPQHPRGGRWCSGSAVHKTHRQSHGKVSSACNQRCARTRPKASFPS